MIWYYMYLCSTWAEFVASGSTTCSIWRWSSWVPPWGKSFPTSWACRPSFLLASATSHSWPRTPRQGALDLRRSQIYPLGPSIHLVLIGFSHFYGCCFGLNLRLIAEKCVVAGSPWQWINHPSVGEKCHPTWLWNEKHICKGMIFHCQYCIWNVFHSPTNTSFPNK